MDPESLLPWIVLSQQEVFSAPPWMSVYLQEVHLPDGKVVRDFHWIDMPDYSVIFAKIPDGRVIMERQYKHGPGEVILTLPAGVIEPGETPLSSARRELLEETGYVADDWRAMGSFVSNANYGCGRAHFFIAESATKIAEPNSNDLEVMEILTLSPDVVLNAVAAGAVALVSDIALIAMALGTIWPEKP